MGKNLLTFLLAVTFLVANGTPLRAVSEQNYAYTMKNQVIPFLTIHGIQRSFFGVDGLKIVYFTVGFNQQGKRGALVIFPGRTESYEKWREFAYDMYQQGYAPIYIIDHRGQGYSGRLANHPQRGHVKHFRDYVEDGATFMRQVVLKEVKAPIYFLGHSMGGAIGGLMLEQYDFPFEAAVFYSPMFGLDLGDREPISTEAYLNFLCLTGKCMDYAPGKTDFDPNKIYDSGEDNTSSISRWTFNQQNVIANHEIMLGGPTNGWVLESLRGTRKARKNSQKIKLPTMIFYGGIDRTVTAKAIEQVCSDALDCDLFYYPTGKHQLQNEEDIIRDDLIERTINFFDGR